MTKVKMMNIYQIIFVQKWRDKQSLSPASYGDVQIALGTWRDQIRIPEDMIGILPVKEDEQIPPRLIVLEAKGQLWKISDEYNRNIPEHNQLESIEETIFNEFFENLGRLELPR